VEVLQSKRATFDLDRDGVISVSELYRGIRTIVAVETGGQQQPWLARHDMVGDFALI
jgi:Ca2+-binding EF-hand superfamily protein